MQVEIQLGRVTLDRDQGSYSGKDKVLFITQETAEI